MWAMFIEKVEQSIHKYSDQIHFSGYSSPSAVWQNACWVFEISSDNSPHLWDAMKFLCREFKQDSIAWTEGVTVFIEND